MSGFGQDYELLKDHYYTIGVASAYDCTCTQPVLPLTFTVSSCGTEILSLSAASTTAQTQYFESAYTSFFNTNQNNKYCTGGGASQLYSGFEASIEACSHKCMITATCVDIYYKNDGTGFCHLFTAGCTTSNDNNWNRY